MVALWVWVSCEMVGSDGIGREKSKSDDARNREVRRVRRGG